MAKILIIDDDEGICFILSRIIRHDAHSVECAYSLEEGITKATSDVFDVVFLDVMLPDGSSLDILPDFKKIASKSEIIMVTALDNRIGMELARQRGAVEYIQKPFLLNEVKLALSRALKHRRRETMRQTGPIDTLVTS